MDLGRQAAIFATLIYSHIQNVLGATCLLGIGQETMLISASAHWPSERCIRENS